MDIGVLFPFLLLVVAFLYASVGHGGASGYLALMALFEAAPEMMKPTALMLNLFVSGVAFLQFYREGYFRWKLFLPFALASVPLSFVGGLVVVDGTVYKKLLGFLLLVPVARFLFFRTKDPAEKRSASVPLSLLIGGVIGFLSGLIGIGGGIILSPVLLLLRWSDQKETAAISAIFIFVNSLAGLAGQLTHGFPFNPDMFLLVSVAFVGGMAGAYFGAKRFPQEALKKILAGVLLLAVYKLLFTYA